MAKKKKRPRAQRRALGRELRKLIEKKERLAELEPGGSPERPIEVPSASVVELRAVELGCIHCDQRPRVDAHDARVVEGRGLRRVRLSCPRCGSKREVWLRIASRALN